MSDLARDLTQKAFDDCSDAIHRTIALVDEPGIVTSIYISTCLNLLNCYLSHLRESGIPEDKYAKIIDAIKSSIDNPGDRTVDLRTKGN